jgi:DNA-binding beta-propeller fold protein YncE
VCVSPNGHDRYVTIDKQAGKVQVIDLAKMEVTGTYDIKFDPHEIVGTNSGKAYLSQGSGQEYKVAMVDTKKKGALTLIGGSFYGSMRMTPDGKRVYASSNGVSPGQTNGFWISDPKLTTSHGGGGGMCEITADGKYIVFQTGFVARIANSATDDLKEAGKVTENRGAVLDTAAKTLWVATAGGGLEKWSVPDFEKKETYNLPLTAYTIAFDPKTKMLYAALDKKKDRPAHDHSGVGNIAIFELKMKD